MLAEALPFPNRVPAGYQCLDCEPEFRPQIHLALEAPERIWTLADLGYDATTIAECASKIAITSPFRVLSREGVEVVEDIALRLQATARHGSSSRVPSHVAGAVYKSRFLRDLCASPVVCEHMSTLCGTELVPHTLPSQQLYINYAPQDLSLAVDSWHFDGIGFDYVLMVSDPSALKGGRFEYFAGTKLEFADRFKMSVDKVRRGVTDELPGDKVVSVEFPAAGYAIFQQGNMVVHRASRLLESARRITMVPGYVARDVSFPDPTSTHEMPFYGEPGICAELARHSARLAKTKLERVIETLSLDDTNVQVQTALSQAIADVEATLAALRECERKGPWSK